MLCSTCIYVKQMDEFDGQYFTPDKIILSNLGIGSAMAHLCQIISKSVYLFLTKEIIYFFSI